MSGQYVPVAIEPILPRPAYVKKLKADPTALSKYYARQAKTTRDTTARVYSYGHKSMSQRRAKPKGAPKTRAAAKNIASTIASYTPLAPLAGIIGEGAGWLGDKIGTAFGWGAYKVKSNSLIKGMKEGNGPPYMHSSGTETVIAHREYITDIISSATPGAFKLDSFYINPGLNATFPWESYIGLGFEEYEPMGIVFEFKSTSADALNSVNTALGTVIMATNYNAGSPVFTGKVDMENSQYAMSFKPSQSMYHPIECDPSQRPMKSQYIRAAAVPSGQDPKTYDLGNFQIATVGLQGTSVVCGELWVSYQFKLRKPISGPQIGPGILSDHYYCTNAQNSTPFGTTRTLRANSSIGGTLSTTTYTFPKGITNGNYLFVVRWSNGSAVTIGEPLVTVTNGTLMQLWVNGTIAQAYVPPGTVASQQYLCLPGVVTVAAPGATSCSISLATGGVIPSGANVDFFITQFNNTIITNPALPPVLARPGADHDIVFEDKDGETVEVVYDSDEDDHKLTMRRLKKRLEEVEHTERKLKTLN